MKEKVNRTNIAEHLVKYQLSLIGKKIEDASKDRMWLYKWTIPLDKKKQFDKYAISLIKKTFKCNTNKAKGILGWHQLQFGLSAETITQ